MARDETRLEQRIRRHHERGELKEAATAAIEGFGPEILGFLKAVVRDEQLAGEVFAHFCEDVWTGLSGFRWESSFRTWGYTLARAAWLRQRRAWGARLLRWIMMIVKPIRMASPAWKGTR